MESNVYKVIDDHELRIRGLETSFQSLKTSQAELQVTVMKEGQATRELLNRFVDHTLDDKKMSQNYKHSEKMKVLGILGGAVTTGGVIYLVVSNLF